MSAPIDLTKKQSVVNYINTMVEEASKNQGLKPGVSTQADSNRWPYTQWMPHVAARCYYPILDTIANTALALFSQTQVREATKSLKCSKEYLNAAHLLQHGWHKGLTQLNNPQAKVSQDIFEFALKLVEIDTMREREATNYLNCGIVGSIGAVLWGIGTYASAQWLNTTGKIVSLLTLAFYAYTWASHRGDKGETKKKYFAIKQLGEKIQKELTNYDDEMKLKAQDSQAEQIRSIVYLKDYEKA